MFRALKKKGIIRQIAIFFLIGIIFTVVLTYLTQYSLSTADVSLQVERIASGASGEVMDAIREYPSYRWLIRYWYENYEDLDIEYDADYNDDTRTEEKTAAFNGRYPDLDIKYITEEEAEKLEPEYQKLFAEISYSWFITRIDQIKLNHKIDYLFGVVTEEPYEDQFFLFSAADPGAVRGTNYEEVYPLGVQVTVNPGQSVAMKNTMINSNHLVKAGEYMDYYEYFENIDDHLILVGLTFNLKDMNSDIDDNTRRGVLSAMLGQLVLSVICLMLIYNFILEPLMTIIHNIRDYTESKDSKGIIRNLKSVHPKNEIGQLSKDVTHLASEMDEYHSRIEAITKERERISTELELASRIQASMLPSEFPAFPDRTEFDIFASMTPAKEVGGDFYDFFLIDDDHLGMVMADVSGKGVPAALFMMVSRILIKTQTKLGKTPSEIIKSVNDTISSNNKEEMFVTVWLGILEISTGKLTYTNAGHEYAAIRQGEGRFELIKQRHGFIVGGMEGMKYREDTMMLKPGSQVFLYTDGVPEAAAGDGTMFGMDRMLDVLNSDLGASPEKVVENIKRSVDDFVKDAEQFDDLTLMCVNYIGKQDDR